ncbi:pilus assembly FimT family protein [Hydrogenimonas sp.]
MHSNRPAFTLLEVLLSIFILFTMGLALLKFDGWIKNEMGRYREKAQLLFTGTPNLYESRKSSLRYETLFDTMKFEKLRDDEIFWLKNLSAKISVGKGKKRTLFQSGELDLTYYLYPVTVKRDDTQVGFIRVVP